MEKQTTEQITSWMESRVQSAIKRAKENDYHSKLIIELPWGSQRVEETLIMMDLLRARAITEVYIVERSTALMEQLLMLHNLGIEFKPEEILENSFWKTDADTKVPALKIIV